MTKIKGRGAFMNLFAQLDCDGQEEKTDVLFENLHVRIERIVSSGQVSPEGFWYEQDEDEWVTVLQGEGRIQYENGDVTVLRTGDCVLLPAGKRHRVSYTSKQPPCIWLCVFSGKEGGR